jgi:hypothetical protein
MAATKLSQYRAALRHLGDIRLATITDDVEARYALDDAWDAATAFVLRQAPWRFALKHAGLAVSGTRVDGYATSYGYPSDWLRTHAVYQVSNGRECPFDFREVGSSSLSVNVSGDVEMRYVSSDYVNPELVGHPWPEHFSAVHAAYLAFSVAYRVTGDPQAETRMSQLFASLLPEAASIDAIPEDPWLPFQRNGAFLRVIQAVAGEDFWRFALKTVPISVTSGAAEGGFTKRFTTPSDWLMTRSLYRLTTDTAYVQSDQRRPFDVREHAGAWHTNAADFYAEYVSSAQAFDSTLWPDLYTTAVLRRLEFEAANLSGDKDALQSAGAAWKDAFATARKSEASPPDPWFDYQISGALQRCIPSIISKGYWRFAFKRLLLNAETDQDAAPTDGAYPYRFTLPGDWLKTHAMFIPYDGGEMPFDVREEQGYWRTSTVSFMVRYVSTAALDPLQWPDSLAKAVQAYLDFETAPADAQKNAAEVWAQAISAALAEWGVPQHTWLRFQLDGRYIEAVKHLLGTARWRFAIKTRLLTADATQASDGTISGTLVPNAFGDGSISPAIPPCSRSPAIGIARSGCTASSPGGLRSTSAGWSAKTSIIATKPGTGTRIGTRSKSAISPATGSTRPAAPPRSATPCWRGWSMKRRGTIRNSPGWPRGSSACSKTCNRPPRKRTIPARCRRPTRWGGLCARAIGTVRTPAAVPVGLRPRPRQS